MKKFNFVLSTVLFLYINAFSQVSYIESFGSFNLGLKNKNEVKKNEGFGGGLIAYFKLYDNLNFGIKAAYKLYNVDQPGVLYPSYENRNNKIDAIYKLRWGWENWDYWNRRYAYTVIDNQAANTNLKASLGILQKMDVVETSAIFNYYIFLWKFSIVPNIQGGYIFATRRLYIVERWSKYFPESNYTFKYSYRTFAPKKNIISPVVGGGLNLAYEFVENIFLNIGSNYIYYDLSKEKTKLLPLSSELNFNLSLNFKY